MAGSYFSEWIIFSKPREIEPESRLYCRKTVKNDMYVYKKLIMYWEAQKRFVISFVGQDQPKGT